MPNATIPLPKEVGFVVIGRNEAKRLPRCLEAVTACVHKVVYVDSGSTDGSPAIAREHGADVIELDERMPFSAARARNEGFRRLCEIESKIAYVQFVDGDCEILRDWLGEAVTFLEEHSDVAAVCGRLHERHPELSIYNMLCDIEWGTAAGEVFECGGIVLVRAEIFEQLGGYRGDMVAGEDPEFCARLRAAGWRIWRLGRDMAFHDAAITRFGQWWTRTLRGGYASAHGVFLHGATPGLPFLRQSMSSWFWGVGLPVIALTFTACAGPLGLTALALYPIQITRLAMGGSRTARENWYRALFLLMGKFPEVIGQMTFIANRLLDHESRLIEYK